MILKSYETGKRNLDNISIFLLYGNNEGLKNQLIKENLLKNVENIEKFDENEIILNQDKFIESLLNKSFFEDKKNIIISRVTDRSFDLIKNIINKEITDIKIILKAEKLDIKSKIRKLLEKDKKNICIPFYADEVFALIKLAENFFKENKINISRESLNIIVDKCSGDRHNLYVELEKIKTFLNGKNKIENESIIKLVNLSENFSVSELVDNCLSLNKKRVIKILNENNFNHDDCILILRTLLIKAKRTYNILDLLENGQEIEDTIRNYKPPIFWKDKRIVMDQLKIWGKNSIEKLIINISSTELLVKKNPDNSLNIVYDLLLNVSVDPSNKT